MADDILTKKRITEYEETATMSTLRSDDVMYVDGQTLGTRKMSILPILNNLFKSSGISVTDSNYSTTITDVNSQPVNTIYTYAANLQSKISNLPSNFGVTILHYTPIFQASTAPGQVMLAIERTGDNKSLYFRTTSGSPAAWSVWVKVANAADVNTIREELDNLDIETDKSLTQEGKAADAKAVGDEISDIKADLTVIEDATYNLDAVLPIDISTYGTAFVGFTVNTAGSTDSNLYIKTNTGRAVCYFKPAEKNGKISIKSSETHSINVTVAKLVNPVIPAPGNASFYVAIDNGYTYTADIVSETEVTIQKGDTVFVDYSKSYGFVMNGNIFTQLKTLSDNVIEQIDSQAESIADGLLQNYTENIYSYTGNLENGYIVDAGTDSPNYRPSKYIRTKGLVPIKRKTSNIYISKHSDAPQTLNDGFTFYFFDANEELIGAKKNVSFSTGCVFPPEGSIYFRYMTSNGGGTDSPDIDPSYAQYFDVYQLSVIGELRNKDTINWCAMGDSITQGWISVNNSGTIGSALAPQYGWVQLLAEYKNWNLTNLGIGGTGYVRGAGSSAPKLVHDTDFAGYDIITLMYGVNDWKSNYNLGTPEDTPLTDAEIEASASDENVGNVCRNLKYIIEKIMSGNPTCKLIVITPINCAEFGSISTNWGIGYELSNSGSLQDMFDAIKTICEYYGVECLDMTHSSIVNRQNIFSCLNDGVHPTMKAHAQLANEICAKIGYR